MNQSRGIITEIKMKRFHVVLCFVFDICKQQWLLRKWRGYFGEKLVMKVQKLWLKMMQHSHWIFQTSSRQSLLGERV